MKLDTELAEALEELRHHPRFKIFYARLKEEHSKLQQNQRGAEGYAVFTAQGEERAFFRIVNAIEEAPKYIGKQRGKRDGAP